MKNSQFAPKNQDIVIGLKPVITYVYRDIVDAALAEDTPNNERIIAMNTYEAKQADRKARYEELAAQARADSARAYNRAREMGEAIPFGQPILVGHHSEQRDRNYRDRIHNTYGKAFALQDKADYYESKAAGVGTGGISSDDPAAIEKLRAELANVLQTQERMKAVNAVLRKHKTDEARIAALVAIGLTEAQASETLIPDCMGGIGFAHYTLSNNSANARRIAARIADLEKRRQRSNVEIEADGYTYREDVAENRILFVFSGKPDYSVRDVLKSHGFKWSPNRGAWVRQLNNSGLWAAKRVRDQLAECASIA